MLAGGDRSVCICNAMWKDNGCAGRGGETKEQSEGSGIRIVLEGAGKSRGVGALDRWNSSMFLNDFLIYRLRDGARSGVISSSLGTSWTSRRSKLP